MGRKKINRAGEEIINNQGLLMVIINCVDSHNIDIKFEDGFISYNKEYDKFKKGSILNPYFPSIFGKGYFGESDISFKGTKEYISWHGMFTRCYSDKYHVNKPSYIGCSIDESWYNFQNFIKWFNENYNPEIMQGWHLDKDILVKGNKVYSPKTCCFVPNEINILFTTIKYKGYRIRPCGKKFQVRLRKLNKEIVIGDFNSKEEAFQAYKIAKEQHIKEVADKWRDKISENVYKTLINNTIEND